MPETCADPAAIARKIHALVPEPDDPDRRRRIAVKEYDEMPTDMNGSRPARLDPRQVGAFGRVFRERRDTLGRFGYGLTDGGA